MAQNTVLVHKQHTPHKASGSVTRHDHLPQEKTILPQEKTILPQEKNILPQEKTILPQENTVLPQENTILPVLPQHLLLRCTSTSGTARPRIPPFDSPATCHRAIRTCTTHVRMQQRSGKINPMHVLCSNIQVEFQKLK